jgi:hypothetical protein
VDYQLKPSNITCIYLLIKNSILTALTDLFLYFQNNDKKKKEEYINIYSSSSSSSPLSSSF